MAQDAHFLEALRYILLNPVRAGLCAHPADWQWTSYLDPLTPLVDEMVGGRRGFEEFVLDGVERLQPV